MRAAHADRLAQQILSHYDEARLSEHAMDRLTSLMPLLTDRAQTLKQLCEGQDYIVFDGAPDMNEDAAALLNQEAKALLKDFAEAQPDKYEDLEDLKAFMMGFLESKGLKMKHIGLPLRAVLTGTKTSPSITDIIVALGPKEVAYRISSHC